MTERKSTFSWQFSESTKGRLIRQIYEEVGRLGIRKQGKKRWPFLGGGLERPCFQYLKEGVSLIGTRWGRV